MSRVKIAEKTVLFVSFPEFFRILSKNFSDFWPKNFKKISKLPTCPEEKFVTWFFFLKFWIVLEFLQKPLAWFSNFYLRVQSKNCGKNSFFCFIFRVFSNYERKFFRVLAKKLQKNCENYLRVQRKSLWLDFFLSFQTFRIFCRSISHGSQNSIYVSRVKIAEKTVSFVFFQNFFDFWAKTFQTFGQKTSRRFQNYLRVQRNSL